MKKQAVLKKTLSGQWTEFEFDVSSISFYVKNLTDSSIYVSFVNSDEQDQSIEILPYMGEEIRITRREDIYVNTIYVYGTGKVEVQALDSYVEVGE